MNDKADRMTETRGSMEIVPTAWGRLKLCFCPCLFLPIEMANSSNIDSRETQRNDSIQPPNHLELKSALPPACISRRRVSEQFNDSENTRKLMLLDKSVKAKSKRGRERELHKSINYDPAFQRYKSRNAECMISNFSEDQLIFIGIGYRGLIALVSQNRLEVSTKVLKKESTLILSKQVKEQKYESYQFNRYWNERYLLFEKFDEGVKIDQGSWESTQPEIISDYVSQKCAGARIIVDAFAGIGSATVWLAKVNSCRRLIACESNYQKAEFLSNNAKVYGVDNVEIFHQNFEKLSTNKHVDLVFIKPKISPSDFRNCASLFLSDFEPSLDKTISKSLKIASNLVLLLPACINIEAVCSNLNKYAGQLGKRVQICSLTIEKLIVRGQLDYILLCFGNLVQKKISAVEQLQFIYRTLKITETDALPKKVIKRIRDDYGMLKLMNLVSEGKRKSSKEKTTPFNQIIALIREQQLLTSQKIEKFIVEKQSEEPSPFEEQKVDDVPYVDSPERTVSYYSHISNISNTMSGKEETFRRKNTDMSIVITRTINSSKEKKDSSYESNVASPLKGARNRISQLPPSSARLPSSKKDLTASIHDDKKQDKNS